MPLLLSALIMYFPRKFIHNQKIVDKLVQAALAGKSFNHRNSRLPSSRR